MRDHPAPIGGEALGSARGRLPAPVPGAERRGLLAQVFYPAATPTEPWGTETFDYARREMIDTMARSKGMPRRLYRRLIGGRPQLDPTCRPKASPEGAGWPVIIFSSGLYGCCEMYTQLCREFASSGAIVLAIEHEDGSGMYAEDRVTGEPILYKKPPKGTFGDTDFRRPFLEQRAADVAEVLATVARCAGAETDASAGSVAAILRDADPSRILLTGHSFGAASMAHYLRTLGAEPSAHPVLGAIIADPWLACMPQEEQSKALQVPFFMIMSEGWNTDVFLPPCRELGAASGERCLAACIVAGTAHQWVSDLQLWLPAWMLRLMGLMGKADWDTAHHGTATALLLAVQALLDPSQARGLAAKLRAEEVVSKVMKVLDIAAATDDSKSKI